MSGWDFGSPVQVDVADLAVVVADLESQLVAVRSQLAQVKVACDLLVAEARAEAVAGREADQRMVFGLFDQLIGMLRDELGLQVGAAATPAQAAAAHVRLEEVPGPDGAPLWEPFRPVDPLRLVDDAETWAPPARLAG